MLIGIIDFLGGWEGKECNDLSQTRHYQHSFPVSLLGISSRDYPELKLKAYTNRVMTSFLAVCLQEACNKFEESERPPRLVLACASMQKLNEWLLRIEMTQRYMTQKEADDIYNLCFEWLNLVWRLFFEELGWTISFSCCVQCMVWSQQGFWKYTACWQRQLRKLVLCDTRLNRNCMSLVSWLANNLLLL